MIDLCEKSYLKNIRIEFLKENNEQNLLSNNIIYYILIKAANSVQFLFHL
jgi:hypothetical protein